MSDSNSPALLPEHYRRLRSAPPPRKTVHGMQVWERALLPSCGIRIDERWGVWIDPDAEILDNQRLGPGTPRTHPIVIERSDSGYALDLSKFDELKGSFANSPEGLPEGFIPARLVR